MRVAAEWSLPLVLTIGCAHNKPPTSQPTISFKLRILRGDHSKPDAAHVTAYPQLIANPQLLRGLCARPVHVHLAAGDSRRRERAGFEESRRPEPAIEPYGCRLSVGR